MSTNPGSAGVPSHSTLVHTTDPEPEEEEQDNIYDASDEEEDALNGTPVQVKTPEQGPAQVDQYCNPPESPEEFRMEYVRENGVTGFMTKVSSRLRTLPDPHDRVRVRHRFWGLIRELKADKTAQPPYDQAAAEEIRRLLEERGLAETLLLDFELLLNLFEERAQKHREQVEKKKQELAEEQRKKQEWDIVKEEDAEDEWEMI